MPECNHGLEFALCDICSPPPPHPAQPRAAPPRATTARAAQARPTAPGAPRAASRATAAAPALDPATARVFHITHVDNLIGIAEQGALLAGAEPLVDISAPGVRAARAARTVGALSVAEHVPFLPSLEAPLWSVIRARGVDPRLALPAAATASDFVVLAASLRALGEVAVADGDAAHPLTRILSDREGRLRMLRAAAADPAGRGGDAEVLVPHRVPLASIAVVAVGSERAKRLAAEALASGGYRTRVAIHPPWFQG
ncbi:MAG: DarT ssDNA thymidine ADP-ribosyltransferase family protein [Microbacteriaceae bacterium]